MAFYLECWGDCSPTGSCQYCNKERGKTVCACGHALKDHQDIHRKLPACYECSCPKFTDAHEIVGLGGIAELTEEQLAHLFSLRHKEEPVVITKQPTSYTMKAWSECTYTITSLEYYESLALIEASEPKGPGLERFRVDVEEIRRMQEEIEKEEMSLCSGTPAAGTFSRIFWPKNFSGFVTDGTFSENPSPKTMGWG